MAKASISVVKGKGSLNHNNREFVTDNVDRDRIKDNITYKCESLEDAYRHCFDEAIRNYNAKQKRADRQIDGVAGYMEQIRTSKNGEKLFYENLIQVGNMRDSGVGMEQGEVCKQVLDEYMRGFQKRNPNLYVFNAVMHLDEQTPHLHIDYIPVAHGYKNGLQARNSLDRAFREQGVDGKSNKYENRTIAWQNGEKDCIEQIMKEHGLERTEETGFKREHQDLEQYKANMEKFGKMEIDASEIPSEKMMFSNEKVAVKKSDLELAELKLSMATAYAEEGKKFVKYAKKSLEEANEYAARKMNAALSLENQAKTKLENVEQEREKFLEIRDDYENLKNGFEWADSRIWELERNSEADGKRIANLNRENAKLKQQIVDLERSREEAVKEAVSPLKAQINDLKRSVDAKVEKATEPLKKQIEGNQSVIADLERRLHKMCETLANTMKVLNYLRFNKKEEYRVNLNQKQTTLFVGLKDYARYWLLKENEHDLATDVEKKMGVDKDIMEVLEESVQKKIEPKEPVKPKRNKGLER